MDVPVFLSDVDKTQIGLIYKGGELTFTGIVDAYPKKNVVEKANASVTGVKAETEVIVLKFGNDYKKLIYRLQKRV